jgi:ankyrin repeat protein
VFSLCSFRKDKILYHIVLKNLDSHRSRNKKTALIYACEYKNSTIAMELLKIFGIQNIIDNVDDENHTALMYACMHRELKHIAIKLLSYGLNMCNFNQLNDYKDAFTYAMEIMDEDVILEFAKVYKNKHINMII